MNKPTTCLGCPFYGDGQGFVPDELIDGAPTLVLGQNPGAVEEREGKPFVGPTGQVMVDHFFPLARLERGKNVSIANVLKCRWTKEGKKVDELPTGNILHDAIGQCTREHLHIPPSTTLVVAQGGHAATYARGLPTKVYPWRGHVLWPTRRGMPRTYAVEHLASIARDPRMWWVAELDWRKIPRIGTHWPQPIPSRLIATEDNWNAVLEWFKTAARTAPRLALDTEFLGRAYIPSSFVITIIGLGYCDPHTGHIHGLQIDCRLATGWMKASFYKQLNELVRVCPVLVQNFGADMPVLKRCAGIPYEAYTRIDDIMLGHAIMYCELPHDLEFQTSIYGLYPKMKHLNDEGTPEDIAWLEQHGWIHHSPHDSPELLYNWGDVLEPLSIWEHLSTAMDMDTQAKGIYENQSLKLIPILLRSMERGIKVNKPRVIAARDEYETRVKQATLLAESYLGKPMNLGSDDQLKYYCYREQGYHIHYDKETKRPTVDEDAIAALRDMVGPVVDTLVPLTLELALHRIQAGADPVLEARVLYQEAQHALDNYIYGLVRSVYNEYDEGKKKKARERVKTYGFGLDDVLDRVYPNFAIHAQKTGRWSTTNPPLAQLPGDLRDVIIPDTGECWLHWDWKGIELHFLEVHSGSRILKQAHDDGIDLHTWTLCKMFGYDLPPNLRDPFGDPVNQDWRDRYSLRSGSDPRRVFAKSARYEMNYGGTGATAAEKAIRMGLGKQEVARALSTLLTADVDYYKWRQYIERQVKATRVIRTFMGRPRRFLTVGRDHSTVVPPKVVREALDYPMQGGVSDVFNTTIVELAARYPYTELAWGMHDAQYWSCPVELVTPELVDGMKGIATTEYVIEGRKKRFMIDWGIIYPPDKETHHDASRCQEETVVEG